MDENSAPNNFDVNQIENFPFEVEYLPHEENQELKEYLQGEQGFETRFVRIGPKKYFFPSQYLLEASNIYNLSLRTDDVFVITFPKSGTTMTQDLVWLLRNDLDYEKAKTTTLYKRSPFLEIAALLPAQLPTIFSDSQQKVLKQNLTLMSVSDIIDMPSPRHVKTHLPLSLMPPSLLDIMKVVYVARDPRDVAVSFYHHYRLTRHILPDREFKPFWNYFIAGKIRWSPYFAHVLEAWEKRNHPNMLFLFYEEIVKDLSGTIRQIADFLGKNLTDSEVEELCHHLEFDNFKNNKSVNMSELREKGVFLSEETFVRKGKIEGWRDYFDDEMTQQAEEWISEHLSNSDFRFPHIKI